MARYESFTPGNGGWVRLLTDDLPGLLYVRLEAGPTGQWEVRDLFLAGDDEPITGEHLRKIRLAQIEADAAEFDDRMRSFLAEPAPDLRTLAAFFTTRYNPAKADGADWVQQSFLAQRDLASRPKLPRRPRIPALPTPGPRRKLERPRGTRYSDDFYRQVANAYRHSVAEGKAPAPQMQTETGAPITTIHRWIRQARKRGHLGPAKQGRTSTGTSAPAESATATALALDATVTASGNANAENAPMQRAEN